MSTSISTKMAAKKFTNIRSDTGSNSSRSTEPRIYLGNYFPIRLRDGVISYGAWLQAYKAEQLRRLNTVLKTKIMSNEEIKEELKRHTSRKSSKGIWGKSSFLFDTHYILKYCKVTDPEDVFSLKISNQGLNLANTEDFHFFINLEIIDAEDNFLKLETFAAFSHLVQLKLPLNKLKNLSVGFGEFPHLQYLDLSYNNLTGDCFQCLGLMPNLQYLNLGNNNISFLPANSTQCFSLSDSKKVRYVRFPRLEVLKLDYNKLESPDIFIPLANIIHLIYLDLEGNSIYHIPRLEKESTENIFPPVDNVMQDIQPPEQKRKEPGYFRVLDDESQKEKTLEKPKEAVEDVEYKKPSDQAERTLKDENLKCQDFNKEILDRENQPPEVLHDTAVELSFSQNESLASKVALPGSREVLYTSEDKSQSSREQKYVGEAFSNVEGSVSSIEGKTVHTEETVSSLEDLTERREKLPDRREELPDRREELLDRREEVHSSKEELLGSREGSFSSKERLPNSKEELSSIKEELCSSKEELQYNMKDSYGDRELLLSTRKASHCCDKVLQESINKRLQRSREGSDGSRKESDGSRKESDGSRKESDGSRKGSHRSRKESDGSRKGSDGSRKGSHRSRKESDGSRKGSQRSRRESDGSRKGSDGSRKGSDGSRKGSADSRQGSVDSRKESVDKRRRSRKSRVGSRGSRKRIDSSREELDGSREKSESGGEVLCSSKEEICGSVVEFTGSLGEISASREGSHICTDEAHDDSKNYCSRCLTEELDARTPVSAVLNDFSNHESFISSHVSDDMLLMEEIPSIEDLKLFMNLSKIKETTERLDDEEIPLDSFNLLGIEPRTKEESLLPSSAAESDADHHHPHSHQHRIESQLESEFNSDELTSDVYSFETSEEESEESEVPILQIGTKTCNCYSTRPVREDKDYKIPFPQLTILNLAHNNVFCQEALMAVADWPMIQQIFLFGNPIMEKTREKEISIMAATLCDRLGVDVFCKPFQDQHERHLEIQKNDSWKVKSVIRKVPKVPVEQLMAIENVQPSSEETYIKSCIKTESRSEKRKNVLLKALSSAESKGHSSLVTEDSQAESSNSDKALPKNVEDQQQSTPFFVTQPKEDDGEFIDRKQSADGGKCMEEKEYIDTKKRVNIKDEMMKEDLLDKEASCDENSSANSPIKKKYKGYEVLFDDKDVNRRIISSNDKLTNINALRQALKTDVPFKRRIPKNFTQELVLKSKEVASKSGNSLDERINKILQNIREQSVLHEVNLGDIFNNQALYKEEYKEARRLIKQIENYYANSFFNKRQQQRLKDKNRPQS